MNHEDEPPTSDDRSNLGFSYRQRKDGDVEILHHGTQATVLRAAKAHAFLARIAECTDAAAQQLMARVTGNYKRGNERAARNHQRNRR